MELRKGYKESEAGVIPIDWNAKTIGETLKIKHGKDQKAVQSENGIYPILGTGGLMGYASRFLYDKESVLIGRKGTIDKPKYMNSPFWTVDTLFYSELNANYLAKYIYYNFLMIDWYAYNEASGVPSLNAKTIENIFIPLPPTKSEQTAIANALSDTDALISSLEKLIEKKRNIKQGAMQELLKPKKGWVVKKLGEIAKIQRGASPRPIESPVWFDENSEVGWVRISDVTRSVKYLTETTQKLSEAGIRNSRSVNEGELIMSICATIGRPILTTFEVCIHDGFVAFYNPKIEREFIYYYLTFIENEWAKSGQTGSQMNLNSNIISSREIVFPSDPKEQKNISETFSDIDKEIFALEKVLAKSKMLKQGMMQELLTGKIRLV